MNEDYDKIKEFDKLRTEIEWAEIESLYNKINKKNNIYYHNKKYVDIEGYFGDIRKKELQNKTDDEIIKLIKDNKDNFKDMYDFLNDGENNTKYDDFINGLN